MATKTNTKINGKDYFRITRTVGHSDDGKPIRKAFYGTSERNAKAKYDTWLEEQIRKQYETEKRRQVATISERAEEYITTTLRVTQKYASGTKDRYEQAYRCHVEGSSLDNMIASEVKAKDIQKFYNSLNVSMPTLKAVHKFMSAFYKWMILNEYAPNILTAVELPVKPDNKRHEGIVTWEDGEIETILNALDASERRSDRHRLIFLVYVLVYTGMRIGEVLGLRYSDIDDDVIHLERQYYKGEFKAPKWNSKRTIPMHDKLKKQFKSHQKWHKKEMRDNHYTTDYIFTTSSGKMYEQTNIRRALSRLYKEIGVPDKSLHVYRATFCTSLCRQGAPIEVTAKIMGHRNLDVTAAHYAQVRQDSQAQAIALLK